MNLPELSNLFLILGAGLAGALVVRIFKLPTLIGYLLGGVVVGSLTAGRLAQDLALVNLANFGVAMLLFSSGVELSFGGLKKSGRFVIAAALAQVALTIGFVSFFAVVVGIPFAGAIFLGAALSLSSTAVVVRLLEGSGKFGSLIGEISVTWMIAQDLLVIPFFFILPVIAAAKFDGGALLPLAFLLAKATLVVLMVALVGRRLGKLFLAGLARTDTIELLVLGLGAWVVAFTTASLWLGLTVTLGVFLSGVMLGESNKETAVLSVTRPIRDLFGALFFTSLGLFLSPESFLSLLGLTIVAGVVILVLKFLISFGILNWFGFHSRLSAEVSAPMSSVGEFAFLIMGLGRSLGFVDPTLFNFVVGLTLFSIAVTPAFCWVVERVVLKTKGEMSKVDKDELKVRYEGHLILCGFGRVGSWVGEALVREKVPVVVIDYHHHSLLQAEQMGIPIIYGDATNENVLEKAGITSAKAVVITLPDLASQRAIIEKVKEVNPKAFIIGRAHHEREREALSQMGAGVVVQPEFEASLSIVDKILNLDGKPNKEVVSVVTDLKKEFGD